MSTTTSKGILGTKLGMTQIFDENARVVPVTVIQAGPCTVAQLKSPERDGYAAVQLAFGEVKPRRITKPVAGHYAKAGVEPHRHLVELRTADAAEYALGQELKADVFAAGDRVDVVGVSKGKGTAGVMKRHGFAGLGGRLRNARPHLQGHAHVRPHGPRARHRAESPGRQGRPGAQPAAGARRRARPQARPGDAPLLGASQGQGGARLMAKVDVVDARGKKSGSVDLPDDVFGVQVNVPVMHRVVRAQLAAARAGTHSTKTRSEVRGGGRKPWRQKGTGRARQGSIRAPQWTGGGVVFGPKPRDYEQRTPKKMRRLALRSALSDRAAEERVVV